MDEIIGMNELKTSLWRDAFENNQEPEFDYDADLDTMYLYFASIAPKERILTHSIDKNASFLVRSSDKEIVGMSFDAFQRSFLPAHAGKSWKLSDKGIPFEHLVDIHLFVTKIEPIPVRQKAPLPRPAEKMMQVEPVFA